MPSEQSWESRYCREGGMLLKLVKAGSNYSLCKYFSKDAKFAGINQSAPWNPANESHNTHLALSWVQQ